MYKNIILEDLEVFSFEREFVAEGVGKIIKICVEFSKNADPEAKLQIYTKEGEEVLIAWNGSPGKRVYYPRMDVAQQIYVDGAQIAADNAQLDYFYFFGGLFLKVTRTSKDTSTKTIKKVTILYEE